MPSRYTYIFAFQTCPSKKDNQDNIPNNTTQAVAADQTALEHEALT